MTQTAIILVLTASTSLAGYVMARRWLGLSGERLPEALARALELSGVSAMFLVLNVGVGVAAVLAVRGLTSRFVSIYFLDDASLVVLSAIQGVVFECWRTAGVGPANPRVGKPSR